MGKINACVFISGKGTNLKNLIIKSRNYNFPINIKLVVSNNPNAHGLNYAKKYFIPYIVVNTNLRNYEKKILVNLKKRKISLICLAGYMKIISNKFLKEYGKKILNIHPSLLPKFKGLNTYDRIIKNKEIKTGCTVHFVNKNLDEGKIIKKKFFFLEKTDNKETIKNKTKILEYRAYPEAIIKIFSKASF